MRPDIIPQDLTGKRLYNFLVKNEALIFQAKKSELKKGDSVISAPMFINEKGQLVSKAEVVEQQIDVTKIKAVVVINTTNYFDSHGDVHIPGIWKRSLANNKSQGFYLLNSHRYNFEDVIAEGCSAVTKTMAWKDLGIDLAGTTEALIFTGIIDQDRNEYMFGQYQKGYVKKHSVGMRYIKIVTCIDDDDYPVQKENWDKYIELVANRKDAEDSGYFWAVLEAEVREGSAVLFASNSMTPTLDISDYDDSTKNRPPIGTGEHSHKDQSNKSMVICNNCKTMFDHSGQGSNNCPNCGQYVSSSNNTTETEPFDWMKAIKEKTFIKF